MVLKHLNVNNCYFHSIIHGANESLKIIDSIFNDGAIKSPESLGVKVRPGCHLASDICLSKITKSRLVKNTHSCFDIYVSRLTSLIIDKEISKKQRVIKPTVISTGEAFLQENGNKTNLYDEYRVREDIFLEYIKGICIPYHNLINDPLTFVPFVVDQILMMYYNGLLDYEYKNKVLREEGTKEAREKRISILDNYIGSIEKLVKDYQLDIPIYLYENSKSPRLVLR